MIKRLIFKNVSYRNQTLNPGYKKVPVICSSFIVKCVGNPVVWQIKASVH